MIDNNVKGCISMQCLLLSLEWFRWKITVCSHWFYSEVLYCSVCAFHVNCLFFCTRTHEQSPVSVPFDFSCLFRHHWLNIWREISKQGKASTFLFSRRHIENVVELFKYVSVLKWTLYINIYICQKLWIKNIVLLMLPPLPSLLNNSLSCLVIYVLD